MKHRQRSWGLVLQALVVGLALLATSGGEGPSADEAAAIAWVDSLDAAFEQAPKQNLPVLLCLPGTENPGLTKQLTQGIYEAPEVRMRAPRFVAVLVARLDDPALEARLRALAGSELVVMPQHMIVHPDGKRVLARKEYWPYGKSTAGIKVFTTLLDDGWQRFLQSLPAGTTRVDPVIPAKKDASKAKPKPIVSPAPTEAEARAAWVAELLVIVRGKDPAQRRVTLEALAKNDKAGDCVGPLIALLTDARLDANARIDVVRTLGIPGLEAAAEPLAALLESDDNRLRGNAAVSLEYIGAAASVAALKKQLAREDSEAVAGHLCRALGRCGAGQGDVRNTLLKRWEKAETDGARVGPIVGLAYFESDRGLTRKLEKQLGKEIVPRAIGGINSTRRIPRMLGWCLSHVGDRKTVSFLRDKVIARLRRENHNIGVDFYANVAFKLEGDAQAGRTVEAAMRSWQIFGADQPRLPGLDTGGMGVFKMDGMRKGRDMSRFTPKADWRMMTRPVPKKR